MRKQRIALLRTLGLIISNGSVTKDMLPMGKAPAHKNQSLHGLLE